MAAFQWLMAAAAVSLLPLAVRAEGETMSADARAKAAATRDKAVEFLLKAQKETGQWGEDGLGNPATTAMVVRSLLGSGKVDAKSPAIEKALKYLLTFRKDDGGFYKNALQNYNTCICLRAFQATGSAEYKPVVDAAVKFVLKGQFGADENIDEIANAKSDAKKNPNYGGIGYGQGKNDTKADLGNTSFLGEALKEAGVSKDHPAWKRMQTFLSRMQLRSESNDQPFAKDAGDDGGFIYEIGNEKAPKKVNAEGKELLRSYGSMTYAGFKSFLYAGLSKDDPRVKSAFAWICRNYSTEENPFMGQSGLYYYYLTFARAMHEWGEPTVTDSRNGIKHNWREELTARFAVLQKPDGSWVNTDKRWMETDPRLATSFVLMAIEECLK